MDRAERRRNQRAQAKRLRARQRALDDAMKQLAALFPGARGTCEPVDLHDDLFDPEGDPYADDGWSDPYDYDEDDDPDAPPRTRFFVRHRCRTPACFPTLAELLLNESTVEPWSEDRTLACGCVTRLVLESDYWQMVLNQQAASAPPAR